MDYKIVGKISHYFDKILVAVLEVSDEGIKVGDEIRIGEFGEGVEQVVESMQVNHQQIEVAKKDTEVALKVTSAVHPGDLVYRAEK